MEANRKQAATPGGSGRRALSVPRLGGSALPRSATPSKQAGSPAAKRQSSAPAKPPLPSGRRGLPAWGSGAGTPKVSPRARTAATPCTRPLHPAVIMDAALLRWATGGGLFSPVSRAGPQ